MNDLSEARRQGHVAVAVTRVGERRAEGGVAGRGAGGRRGRAGRRGDLPSQQLLHLVHLDPAQVGHLPPLLVLLHEVLNLFIPGLQERVHERLALLFRLLLWMGLTILITFIMRKNVTFHFVDSFNDV